MNSLMALVMWWLSLFGSGDEACAMLGIPDAHCQQQRVEAGLLPDEQAPGESSGEKRDHRLRVDDRGRVSHISNGF